MKKTFEDKIPNLINEATKKRKISIVFFTKNKKPNFFEIEINQDVRKSNPIEIFKKSIKDVYSSLDDNEQLKFRFYKFKVKYLDDEQTFSTNACLIRIISPTS